MSVVSHSPRFRHLLLEIVWRWTGGYSEAASNLLTTLIGDISEWYSYSILASTSVDDWVQPYCPNPVGLITKKIGRQNISAQPTPILRYGTLYIHLGIPDNFRALSNKRSPFSHSNSALPHTCAAKYLQHLPYRVTGICFRSKLPNLAKAVENSSITFSFDPTAR